MSSLALETSKNDDDILNSFAQKVFKMTLESLNEVMIHKIIK